MTFDTRQMFIGAARCTAILIGTCLLSFGQNVPVPDNSFVIRNARVFDGRNVSSSSDVWVQDGYIKAVGMDFKVPAHVTVINATGDTLLPGFIDSQQAIWLRYPAAMAPSMECLFLP